MQLPIVLGLHRSRLQPRVFGLLLACGLLLILIYPVPVPFRLLAATLLGVWGGWVFRRLRPEITALELAADGGVKIRLAGQTAFSAVLCVPGAVVHPWLTVLRLEAPDGWRHSLVVTPDCLAREDFRRLRVFLRWRAAFSASGAAA